MAKRCYRGLHNFKDLKDNTKCDICGITIKELKIDNALKSIFSVLEKKIHKTIDDMYEEGCFVSDLYSRSLKVKITELFNNS